MLHYLLMCRSLTYAQRAARALERIGVTAVITKAPKSVSKQGCGYCVKVSERRFQSAVKTLDAKNIPYGRLFRIDDDGGYTEVSGA